MTDIAKLAGVSQSTVSLVLNRVRDSQLTKETRDRVNQVASDLGYQVTRRAALPTPASTNSARNLIVYIADEISASPHPAITIDGAREAAWEHNCLLSVFATRGDTELELATLAAAEQNPAVLGVIYAKIFTRSVEPPVQLLPGGKLPCVLLNCYDNQRRLSSVIPGEVGGGFVATEYLIAQGHTRIGFINGEPWMDAARDRAKGYRQALATADLPCDPQLMRNGDWMSSTGFDQAMALLQLERPPTAIFCANDLMALGALQAVRLSGLKVPDDVSVLGYDDQEIARHSRPPLSTLLLPNFEMGHWAADRLVTEAGALGDDGAHHAEALVRRQIKIDCPLRERESVAAVPQSVTSP